MLKASEITLDLIKSFMATTVNWPQKALSAEWIVMGLNGYDGSLADAKARQESQAKTRATMDDRPPSTHLQGIIRGQMMQLAREGFVEHTNNGRCNRWQWIVKQQEPTADEAAEACAMMLLDKASEIGSRTKAGLTLGELAEAIRQGKWKDVG